MNFTVTSNTNDKLKFYNPDDVIAIVKTSLEDIMEEDYDFYGNYNFKISNEQYYVPDEERDFGKNTIFIVIKMMRATLDFNQVIVPFTLTALSEHNNVNVCQRLLLEYSQTYNLTDGSGTTAPNSQNQTTNFMYKQTYDTPTVLNNFQEVYDGFRSVLVLTGNILINYSVLPIKKIMYYPLASSKTSLGAGEEIKTLANAFSYSNTLDTQPYSGKNRTESISKYGTLTLSFTIYSQDNSLVRKLITMALQERERESGQVLIDTMFYFGLTFAKFNQTNGNDTELIVAVKMNDFDYSQAVGQFPTINVSFTE